MQGRKNQRPDDGDAQRTGCNIEAAIELALVVRQSIGWRRRLQGGALRNAPIAPERQGALQQRVQPFAFEGVQVCIHPL